MNEPPDESVAGGVALFDEKSFYLEEFYGKSLLFALIPPAASVWANSTRWCARCASLGAIRRGAS